MKRIYFYAQIIFVILAVISLWSGKSPFESLVYAGFAKIGEELEFLKENKE